MPTMITSANILIKCDWLAYLKGLQQQQQPCMHPAGCNSAYLDLYTHKSAAKRVFACLISSAPLLFTLVRDVDSKRSNQFTQCRQQQFNKRPSLICTPFISNTRTSRRRKNVTNVTQRCEEQPLATHAVHRTHNKVTRLPSFNSDNV